MSPATESAPLLEVAVCHPRDAAAATAGEADRLLLRVAPAADRTVPDPAVLSAVLRETDLPVRVLMTSVETTSLAAGDVEGTVLLGRKFCELGAEGLSYGYLDRDNEIDRETCAAVASSLPGVPWTFHRAFDASFEPRRSWRAVAGLPGLDGVASAGSLRGMAAGAAELLDQVRTDPRTALLLVASGGLQPDAVPWLVRAGVRQFALAEEVRQDGSWSKASVDPASVRAWRLLIDDAHQRALGVLAD